MRVIEGGAEDLSAGQILKGRRDAAADLHARSIDRNTGTETWQGRAIGTQQEDRLDQVAARLLDGKCGKIWIVDGALAHHAVHGEGELLANLCSRQLGHIGCAAPLFSEQLVRSGNRGLSTLDCD